MKFNILLFLSALTCFGTNTMHAVTRIINNSNAPVHVDYDLPIYSRADTTVKPIKSQQELQDLLHEAIITNSTQEIMQVIKAGADVNLFKDGKAPLMWATILKKFNSAEVLKKCGAVLPCPNNMLYRAILNDSAEDVKHAINAGADPNVAHLSNKEPALSPLGWAVSLAKPQAAQALLEHGALTTNPMRRNHSARASSWSFLEYALLMKDIKTALVLLKHDKSLFPDANNINNNKIFRIVVDSCDVFEYVVSKIDPFGIEDLVFEFLQECINRGYNINSTNLCTERINLEIKANASAWVSAITSSSFNSVEILELLMKNGANPNQLIRSGLILWTPLHLAIRANNLSAVKFLLDAGADLTKKAGPKMASKHCTINPPGTSLNYAQALAFTHMENQEVIDLLIKYGAR